MTGTTHGPGGQPAGDPHQRLRELLGVHALGRLAPGEDAAVRAHLDGCADCQAELAEIAPLRRALDGVDPERLDSPASPPPDLGEQVRRSVAAERAARALGPDRRPVADGSPDAVVDHPAPGSTRGASVVPLRRRRRVRLLAAAAAVVVLGGGVLGGGVLLGRSTAPEPPRPGPFEAVELQLVGEEEVSVEDAELVPHTWGVELRVRASGFEEGEVYRASFVDERGRSTPAGEFLGTGEDEMVCNLQAALLRPQATQVVIVDADGEPVLRADI
jgi:anti-sigma factor RsiW